MPYPRRTYSQQPDLLAVSSPKHAMATHEENQHARSQKLKFFRVLLNGFNTKLAIPQRLTNHFIKENLTYVTLLSPLGKSAWNVRIGGDSKLGLNFADGWGRFVAAHRLSFGDFLVFKCIGSTLFQVTIFDKSTCEKDCYNYKVTNIGNYNIAGDDVPAGDDQGENCGHQKEYSECFKKQTTPSSSGERSSSPPILMQQESNIKARDQERSACKRKALQKPVHDHKAKDQGTEQQGGKRDSHFEITMTPKCKYEVNIPVKFARSNGLSSFHQMFLRDPSGRGGPWPVTLLHCKRSNGRCSLSAGWRDFRIGNNLKDGDVCVFQLKKKNEMLVQIRRSCEEDGSKRSKSALQQATDQLNVDIAGHDDVPGDDHGENSGLKEYSECFRKQTTPLSVERTPPLMMQQKSKRDQEERSACGRKGLQKPVCHKDATYKQGCKMGSHFAITISPKYMKAVNIPAKFARSNGLSNIYQMLLIRDPSSGRGGSWPVKLLLYKQSVGHDRYLRLTTGWRDFRVGNDLKDGDVCVFQLKKKKKKNEMLVQIHRSCEDDDYDERCRRRPGLRPRGVLRCDQYSLEF